MLNVVKKGRLKNIEEVSNMARAEIEKLLSSRAYKLVKEEYHRELFGSRFYEWINIEKKHCYRLIWDGRDSWFILQESRCLIDPSKLPWSDVSVVPFDANNEETDYCREVIGKLTKHLQDLRVEINEFWKWANKSAEEYSENRGFGEWECEYPNWKRLYESVELTIDRLNNKYDSSLADALIQTLAVDNESERVLEIIESTLVRLHPFIEQVVSSSQHQAKWQIAELLGRCDLEEAKEFLIILVKQDDKYVTRRALISLNKVDEKESTVQARKYIDDKDDYLRKISLDIIEKRLRH